MTQIGIAVVEHEGCFLVGTRSANSTLPGCHEFPGGKQLAGEISSQTAIRECKEETGLQVSAIRLLHQRSFHYAHDEVELDFWLCALLDSEMARKLPSPWRWVRREQLGSLNFPPANDRLIEQLQAEIETASDQKSKGEFD